MAYMTQKGYDELVAKLQHMESIDRPAASAAIAEARDKGDLSENAEYDAAKEWQGKLETEIAMLKKTIIEAKIIDTTHLDTSTVQILSTVESPTSTSCPCRQRPTSRAAKSAWKRLLPRVCSARK